MDKQEKNFVDTIPSSLYSEYIRIRRQAIFKMIENGSSFVDLELVSFSPQGEFLYDIKKKYGYKFTQKIESKNDSTTLTYTAEPVSNVAAIPDKQIKFSFLER